MQGRLEVIVGPMFSGKTEELIRRIRREDIAGHPVLVVKPDIDTRSDAELASHDNRTWPATNTPADEPAHLLESCQIFDVKVLGVEEVQLFSEEIVAVLQELARRGVRVIAAGLDLDYREQPFGSIGSLMAVAERVDKLTAICSICGDDASRSQRLSAEEGQVVIGAADKYAPRCRLHYVRP